jgi:hypothetical protein
MSDDYRGEFSVCQFFDDGMYEYVRRWVPAEEAVKAFAHYTSSVAAKTGVVERVIITDGGDFTNLEWVNGKGFTYDGVNYQQSPHTSLHPHVKVEEEDQ